MDDPQSHLQADLKEKKTHNIIKSLSFLKLQINANFIVKLNHSTFFCQHHLLLHLFKFSKLLKGKVI